LHRIDSRHVRSAPPTDRAAILRAQRAFLTALDQERDARARLVQSEKEHRAAEAGLNAAEQGVGSARERRDATRGQSSAAQKNTASLNLHRAGEREALARQTVQVARARADYHALRALWATQHARARQAAFEEEKARAVLKMPGPHPHLTLGPFTRQRARARTRAARTKSRLPSAKKALDAKEAALAARGAALSAPTAQATD